VFVLRGEAVGDPDRRDVLTEHLPDDRSPIRPNCPLGSAAALVSHPTDQGQSRCADGASLRAEPASTQSP
jgi:hypothetical protein